MITGISRLAIASSLLALAGCAGMSNTALGLTDDGRLAPCPATPNCVSSDATDDEHGIAAFELNTDAQTAWSKLVEHVEEAPSLTIKTRESDYLHVEARTRWLRFTDDVEFHLRAPDDQIAIRSASRIGYSDLGANRRRLETLRATLADAGIVEASPTGSTQAERR